MNFEKQVLISKLLIDLLAINLFFGIVNLAVFDSFWIDGWSYPSLFIIIQLSVISLFFLLKQSAINPSFNLKDTYKFTWNFLLYLFVIVLIYWLFVNDKRYYFVHMFSFILLTFSLLPIVRFIWQKILRYFYMKIYTNKNAIIIADSSNFETIQNVLYSMSWLKINPKIDLEYSSDINTKLQNFLNQYRINFIVLDDTAYQSKSIDLKKNFVLYITPDSKVKNYNRLYKFDDFYLYFMKKI